MSTSFQKFKIQSTLEYSTDHFALNFTGADPFRNKTKTDTVTLTIGLLDALNAPQVITFLNGGFTDEFEIVITKDRIAGTKRGRDLASFMLDGVFRKKYYRFPNVLPPLPAPKFDSFGAVIPVIPQVVGQFKASQIATEAAAHVGLSLTWGIPDYIVNENFFAAGRVIDTIKKLIQPFTFVAPFQADIFIENGAVVIRARRGLNPAPDYSISLAAMKREQATLRVRKTNRYGLVTLRGIANPLGQTGNVFVEGEVTLVDTQETFDPEGALLTRVVTTSTYSTPSKNLLEMVKETYATSPDNPGVFLTRRDTTTNEWEAVAIDTAGPVTQKKHISQTVISEGFDDNNTWVTLEQIETGYSYDGNGFELGETTRIKTLDSSQTPPVLVDDKLTVKTMRDIATLITEQTTEVYQYQEVDTGQIGTIKRPVLQSRDTQQQSGTRPGGPGRARPLSVGDNPGQVIEVTKLISTDPLAVDVNADTGSLTRPQMLTIIDQFVQASFIWEYEALFTGVNMPWIKRGQYLQVTGVTDSDGNAIVLPTMLVLEANADYDESIQQAKSTVEIRCIGWSTT